MKPYYEDGLVRLFHGDCLDVLRTLPDVSVDSVVTDPPYGLEFMGKEWDSPWKRGDDINTDAGMTKTGYTDGRHRLPRPTFTGSTNPKCLVCGGTRRGRRDGTAKVAVCLCLDGGHFPNVRAAEMRAFGQWCELWTAECLRVLKPGGHLLAFGGTRTSHRLACAIEDAGFEIRDSIAWLYGSGFPKSLDVSKAIDKAAGAQRERYDRPAFGGTFSDDNGATYGTALVDAPATPAAEQWQGWGTALKPAHEPIVVARKPLAGTVAANVLTHGTGALNIDDCRIGDDTSRADRYNGKAAHGQSDGYRMHGRTEPFTAKAGRWPANVVLDEHQAAALDEQSGELASGSAGPNGHTRNQPERDQGIYGGGRGLWTEGGPAGDLYGDTGGASRFFYTAKAGSDERPTHGGTSHPTVKPLALMRWLVRLVTPPGGTVLEPFAGSGTTAEACLLERLHCIAIERETDYLPLILQRIHRRRDPIAYLTNAGHDLGLFGEAS